MSTLEYFYYYHPDSCPLDSPPALCVMEWGPHRGTETGTQTRAFMRTGHSLGPRSFTIVHHHGQVKKLYDVLGAVSRAFFSRIP